MTSMLQHSVIYFISYLALKPPREAVWDREKLKAKVIVIAVILYYYVVVINPELQCNTPESSCVLKLELIAALC